MIKLMRAVVVLLLFALAAAGQTPAKDWTSVRALPVGTEVRISAGSRTVSGDLQNVTDDSLIVNSGKGQETFTRQEITKVSVKKRGHRVRNALIGLGIGAGAGLAIGFATTSHCTGFCNIVPPGEVRGAAAGGGAAVGAFIGAIIHTGGWREVYKK